ADLDQPRSRRAGDLAELVMSVVGLALISLVASPPSAIEGAINGVIAAIPSGLGGLWTTLVHLLGLTALVAALATLWRGRWAVLRDMAVGAALAVILTLL